MPSRGCTGCLPNRRSSANSGCMPLSACSPYCCMLAGAQCAHAAVGAVERLHDARQGAALAQWERCGQPKICLRANSTLVSRPVSECSTTYKNTGCRQVDWVAGLCEACPSFWAATSPCPARHLVQEPCLAPPLLCRNCGSWRQRQAGAGLPHSWCRMQVGWGGVAEGRQVPAALPRARESRQHGWPQHPPEPA